MTESRQTQIPKKKKAKTEEEETGSHARETIDEEKMQKLQELDQFMENVLQNAGEEFLEEFKQVEGE